jgi:ADP-heptose:LPS heptosyltransferase
VRQHNQIGDMLCSLTLYKALKKKYPDSRITLVAAKTNYEIPYFDINSYLDRVLVFNKSSLKTILKFIKDLRSRKYQIGVVPSTIVLSRTSHIINRISGATVRVGVKSVDGKENESHKYLNVKSDFNWKKCHQIERNLQVVRQIGCDLSTEEINSIRINISEEDLSSAKEFIEQNFPDKTKKIIAYHPGAGKEANVWNLNNFIALIKKLYQKHSNYILITSGWTDEKIVGQICKELTLANMRYKVLQNESVKKLGAILSMIDLYITNDTGTMHIAGYSGAKLISLFGPTNPAEWAPLSENQKYIKSAGADINGISVDEVFTLAESFFFDNKN